jgi:RNA polymerase sigma-70 factor (ECF subfamily)
MKFPDTPLPSPTDLDHRIPRAIAGDRDALESLLVVYYDDLLVFIESRMSAQLRAVHDVEDVLHETVISAFLAVTRLEARSNREFRNWLRTIAEHRIIDLARSLRGKVRGGDFHRVTTVATESGSLVDLLDLCVAELSKASAKVRREEGVQELQKQLATLPDHYRRAVELRFLRELSLAETAQAMELSEAQVRNILYRAREILIDRLGNSSLYRFHD